MTTKHDEFYKSHAQYKWHYDSAIADGIDKQTAKYYAAAMITGNYDINHLRVIER